MMREQAKPGEVIKASLFDRLPALELALQSLAQAMGSRPLEHSDISEFFHSFMDNCWDPYEEVTRHDTDALRQADHLVLQKEHQLLEALGEEHRDLMEQYSELNSNRAVKELEYAFLVGYQCALRFILLGILPPAELMRGGQREPGTTEKELDKNET